MNVQREKKDFYNAILNLKNESDCEKFFYDLLTENELKQITKRWQIALKLNENTEKNYRQIAKELKTSITTVGRVKSFLDGNLSKGGYQLILNRIGN